MYSSVRSTSSKGCAVCQPQRVISSFSCCGCFPFRHSFAFDDASVQPLFVLLQGFSSRPAHWDEDCCQTTVAPSRFLLVGPLEATCGATSTSLAAIWVLGTLLVNQNAAVDLC